MPKFEFLIAGKVQASDVHFAARDLDSRLKSVPALSVDAMEIMPERELCVGSEEPATHAMTAQSRDMPYNMGRCSACGVQVPLLSRGDFQVIKHLSPSSFPDK